MPDLPISGLSSARPASTALLVGVVNATTVKMTVGEALNAVTSNLGTSGSSGQYLKVSTANSTAMLWVSDRWGIGVQFNAAAASQIAQAMVPADVFIDEWHMVLSTGPTSAVGSAVVEVRLENRSSTPAASGSQISSGSVPTLSDANDGGSTAISSWSATSANAGQWFTFYVVSVSSADTINFHIGGRKR